MPLTAAMPLLAAIALRVVGTALAFALEAAAILVRTRIGPIRGRWSRGAAVGGGLRLRTRFALSGFVPPAAMEILPAIPPMMLLAGPLSVACLGAGLG